MSTTITMPVPGAWPVAASMRSTARTESASSLAKPPEASREPASGPPKKPATSTNRNTASRLRRGWELRKRDTRPDRRGAVGSWSGVGVERGGRVWFVMPRLSAAGAPGSSCRGRHFPSWPRAAYSRGGTPRAVRCGRGIHHPTRTPARLARHPRGDPGRGADAVRRERVRRHVGPRGRHRRRGRRGAGAPLLRDQGRPVPGRAAACRSTRARCWLPVAAGGLDGAGERLLRTFLSVWDDEATRLPLLALVRGVVRPGAVERLVRDGFLPHRARPGRRRARRRPARAPDVAGRLAADRARDRPLRRSPSSRWPRRPHDDLVATYAPTLQRYLEMPLP